MKKFWLNKQWLPPHYFPTAILFLGMCFASAGTWWLNHNEKNKLESEFNIKAERLSNEIEQRLSQQIYGLNGVKSLFGVDQHLSTQAFHTAINTHNLQQEYPGVRGFGFIESVDKAELDAYIARQRKNVSPEFALQEYGENKGKTRYILKYFETPYNRHFVGGIDFGSDPRRAKAIEEAIESGMPSMSPLIYAPPKTEKKASTSLFVPVYKTDAPLNTKEERRAALLGVVYAPILLNELMSTISEVDNDILQFQLTNTQSYNQGHLTQFFSSNALLDEAKNTETARLKPSLWSTTRLFTLHQRDFQLTIASTAKFEAGFHRSIPIAFFIATSLISALLASLLKIQMSISERIQSKLDAAVRDNDALLSTLNMHAIVSVTDANGGIIDVNEAFCRISGYPRETLLGQNHRIISSREQSSQFWSDVWSQISSGTPWRGEVCNRARDGALYWVDTFIAPFKSSDGIIEKYIAICTDVTENKMAAQRLQAALRDSDALLSTLNMHAIVSIANGAGKIIEVNQAYCRISGYTREEILEGNHKIVATGVQSPDFLSNMWRTISSGTPWRGEVCNRTKSGSLYWVDTFIAPFKNANGQIDKFISIRTDITASKKAASRLANQRSALAHIIEGTNVGTWEWNVDTGEMRLNERWADQIGYELNELGSLTIQVWDDLTHPEDLVKAKRLMQQHFSHDLSYYECENRLRHKNGHWIWVLTRGRVSSYTPLGKPEWVSGTQMDITERKKAEAELQKSTQLLLTVRDQLTKAAEVAELGIWSWDVRTNELVFNERMFEIYEVPQAMRHDKLLYDFWRSRLHPDDVEETEERLRAAIAGTHAYSPIFRIISPTKGIRYIQAAGGVERDEHGNACLVTGINRDITMQYQAEEALRKAKQAADDASQAKSAFLANMSHEIRTPMNAILGMLSLLRKTPLSAQQSDYAAKTEGAARSLLNLLNDILDISKVEAGKMSLDPHPFRLDQLLIDLSDLLSINIAQKPVDILFDIDPRIPNRLIGDALRLRQVLTNLGSNAVKFTEQGEVIVMIKMLERNNDTVRLRFAVKDTGIGIAPENHEKIFTGFTQAEASTTRRFGGSGLGIAISQGLVDMMGGKLEVESALGAGACFYFSISLPVAQEQKTRSEEPQATTSKIQLLIAEANIFVREHVKSACIELQFETEFVDSTEAALHILRTGQTPIDAILIDWDSIENEGWGSIHAMRELANQRGLSMLLIMRETEHTLLQRASPKEQLLFDQILLKPINAKKLQEGLLKTSNSLQKTDQGQAALLQDLRLLLVEDNINNQQVARELLQAEGATIAIANHGLEALEMIANERLPFDLVLMDLQMPIMDGYTATKKIRSELGRTKLPIIAMSANVMESDKQACIAAGLNDHIGKPFDVQHLVQVILQHTARNTSVKHRDLKPRTLRGSDDNRNTEGTEDTEGKENAEDAELNETAAQLGIDIYTALNRLGGKQDLYLRMLDMFRNDLQSIPAQLHTCIPDHLKNALRHLHTMKGLSATLGANEHAKIFATIEKQFATAINANNIEECRPLVHTTCQTIGELDRQLAAMAKYLRLKQTHAASVNTTQAQVFVPEKFQRKLAELAEQLENADMAATETILELQTQFGASLHDKLLPIETAISTLDFTLAQALCADLMEQDHK